MATTLLVAFFTNLQLNTHDLSLLALPGALGLSYLSGAHVEGIRTVWIGALWTLYVATGLFLPQVFGLPVRLTTLLMVLMLGLLVYSILRNIAGEKRAISQALA
jgi:hypothetical protein